MPLVDEEISRIPEEFVCPITHSIMEEPLMTKDGFCFERNAILEWILVHGTCPLTRRPLSSRQLVTNVALKSRIHNWCAMQENWGADDGRESAASLLLTNDTSNHLMRIKQMVTLARRTINHPETTPELVCR